MKQAEFEAKAMKALNGPANFDRIWALLEESKEPSLQVTLFKNEGDKKPFRGILFVSGEENVEAAIKFLDERRKA